jgi:hypothetical protein
MTPAGALLLEDGPEAGRGARPTAAGPADPPTSQPPPPYTTVPEGVRFDTAGNEGARRWSPEARPGRLRPFPLASDGQVQGCGRAAACGFHPGPPGPESPFCMRARGRHGGHGVAETRRRGALRPTPPLTIAGPGPAQPQVSRTVSPLVCRSEADSEPPYERSASSGGRSGRGRPLTRAPSASQPLSLTFAHLRGPSPAALRV